MPSSAITLSQDEVLGEYVDIEGLRGLVEQRLGVGPDLLALLIRDGQIVEAAQGAHVSVGGFWRGIKDTLFGQHSLRLLLADLKPFPLTASFEAMTQDNSKVGGELILEMQVNPEKPANILGFMKERRAVAKQEVLTRLMPHLTDRAVQASVRRVKALDLRGNIDLQNKVQAEVMGEVERIAGDLGLLVRSVSLNWAFNEDEIAAMEARAKTRQREAAELDAQILNRAVEREGESTLLKIRTDADVEKLRHATDAQLRQMVQSDELALIDARSTARRVEEMNALRQELDLNKGHRLDALLAETEAVDHAADLARRRGRQLQEDLALRTDLARNQGGLEEAQNANQKAQSQFAITQARLRGELRVVERDIEAGDESHRLKLDKLRRLQEEELRQHERGGQFKDIRDLADANAAAAAAAEKVRMDAEERRAKIARDSAAATLSNNLAIMSALKGLPPDQIMALQAGISPEVANIIVEQTRARTENAGERERLLREMVQMANDRSLATEAQAREFFAQGMQGAAGVAQGIGGVVAGAFGHVAPPARAPQAQQECPHCHRMVRPAADGRCPVCQEAMGA